MEEDFNKILEKNLKPVIDELHDLNARREIPFTTNDIDNICEKLDNVCEKLDTLIELFKNQFYN